MPSHNAKRGEGGLVNQVTRKIHGIRIHTQVTQRKLYVRQRGTTEKQGRRLMQDITYVGKFSM